MKDLNKEIEAILIKSMTDKADITYWDGCTPELVNLFTSYLKSFAKKIMVKEKDDEGIFSPAWTQKLGFNQCRSQIQSNIDKEIKKI